MDRWCAYVFAGIALISLPSAINQVNAAYLSDSIYFQINKTIKFQAMNPAPGVPATVVIVNWIAQTFLQLVLLSVIMVCLLFFCLSTVIHSGRPSDYPRAHLIYICFLFFGLLFFFFLCQKYS